VQRSAFAFAVVSVAACSADPPTRGDCARAIAHVITLEGVSLVGDPDFTRDVGKELAEGAPMTEAEAMAVIRNLDLGDPKGGGDGVRRVEECRAKRTKSEVDCMQRATTAAAAHACVRTTKR
jgi:hypothetical protein